MRMRGALCLSPLRFSSKFQLRPLVVVGVFNFTDGRKGTPGPIKLLARSRSSPRFHSSRRSAPHATKNTTPRPPLELHRPPLAGSSAASPSRSIPKHARIRRAEMELVLVISLPLVALVIIVAIILCIICR